MTRRRPIRRVGVWMLRLIRRAPFESAVLLLALAYVALHLSPSSYSVALGQLGEQASPLAGTPRWIRSDEWSVVTPLFQAAVNNDFREINETSFYGETLRSFVGLPLLNWAVLFKPQVWAFFILPPALAYSIYWASIAVLMFVGWSLVLRTLGFSRTTAGFVAMFLFFSPFVQAGSWTPQLALFPWVLLALVRIRSNVRMSIVLALLVPAWLMSLFYVPGLPPLLFLAVALCLAFRPEVFERRRLASAIAGVGVGAAITLVYFGPVLRAYADSEYPGGRWTEGGALPVWQAASQFLPGTTTEIFTNLVADNISEAATVSSWLPVLAVCLVDHRAVRRRYGSDAVLGRDLRRIATLGLMWIVITLWQLLPLVPLSYVFGFGFSPEARTLFASGALLLVAAAYAIDRLPLRVTAVRLAVFAGVVAAAWLLASFRLQPTSALLPRDELLVLGSAAVLAVFATMRVASANWDWRGPVLLGALVSTAPLWGLFNPVQSTRVIFGKPETELTRRLDALAATRSDGAIAVSGFHGAILNGVGYRSVAHVMVVPRPQLFRPFFPSLDEQTFNEIFNRYAHIRLTTKRRPYLTRFDKIYIPVQTMSRYAATR